MARLHCDGEPRVSSTEGQPGYDVTCSRLSCDWERHVEYASRGLILHHEHLQKPLEVVNETTPEWAAGIASALRRHGCRLAL